MPLSRHIRRRGIFTESAQHRWQFPDSLEAFPVRHACVCIRAFAYSHRHQRGSRAIFSNAISFAQYLNTFFLRSFLLVRTRTSRNSKRSYSVSSFQTRLLSVQGHRVLKFSLLARTLWSRIYANVRKPKQKCIFAKISAAVYLYQTSLLSKADWTRLCSSPFCL